MARRDAATNDDDRAAVQGEIEAFGETTLSVNSAGAARIAFLDEAGNVVAKSGPEPPASGRIGLHRNGAERPSVLEKSDSARLPGQRFSTGLVLEDGRVHRFVECISGFVVCW